MSEEQSQQAMAGEQAQPQFQLQKIYTKDMSFELPNAPQVFQETGQAEVNLNLSQRVNNIDETTYEVILSVTVTAVSNEKTSYLAEVHQAGLFTISGLPEPQLQGELNTLCPHTLFPFAARSITDMVAAGGFPPLVLQPINFEQVYAQRMSQASAQADGAADMEVQGNA